MNLSGHYSNTKYLAKIHITLTYFTNSNQDLNSDTEPDDLSLVKHKKTTQQYRRYLVVISNLGQTCVEVANAFSLASTFTFFFHLTALPNNPTSG